MWNRYCAILGIMNILKIWDTIGLYHAGFRLPEIYIYHFGSHKEDIENTHWASKKKNNIL